jgi:hypothetical protein
MEEGGLTPSGVNGGSVNLRHMAFLILDGLSYCHETFELFCGETFTKTLK